VKSGKMYYGFVLTASTISTKPETRSATVTGAGMLVVSGLSTVAVIGPIRATSSCL